eukprot:PhM_4_TR4371/c0_g1_i1/m.70733
MRLRGTRAMASSRWFLSASASSAYTGKYSTCRIKVSVDGQEPSALPARSWLVPSATSKPWCCMMRCTALGSRHDIVKSQKLEPRGLRGSPPLATSTYGGSLLKMSQPDWHRRVARSSGYVCSLYLRNSICSWQGRKRMRVRRSSSPGNPRDSLLTVSAKSPPESATARAARPKPVGLSDAVSSAYFEICRMNVDVVRVPYLPSIMRIFLRVTLSRTYARPRPSAVQCLMLPKLTSCRSVSGCTGSGRETKACAESSTNLKLLAFASAISSLTFSMRRPKRCATTISFVRFVISFLACATSARNVITSKSNVRTTRPCRRIISIM